MDIDCVFRFFGVGGSGVAYEKLDASAHGRFILIVKFDAFQFLMRCDGDADDLQREVFVGIRIISGSRQADRRQTTDRGQKTDVGWNQSLRAGLPM